jgi:hypothetical protein
MDEPGAVARGRCALVDIDPVEGVQVDNERAGNRLPGAVPAAADGHRQVRLARRRDGRHHILDVGHSDYRGRVAGLPVMEARGVEVGRIGQDEGAVEGGTELVERHVGHATGGH